MAEHTPGPWEVEERGASVWADGQQVAQTAASPGVGMEIHWDMNQRIANARLIAAAPELLEAAQQIAQYEGEGPPSTPWQDIVREMSNVARAAIAKATKETT